MSTSQEDTKEISLLEAFITNPELAELEEATSEFNLFEAIGMVHQEIRHSTFLAHMLDPNYNHGLGDAFLRKFLKTIVHGESKCNLSAIDVDLANFGYVEVRREWRHIDILVIDHGNKWVCAIENKIHAKESEEQLKTYLDVVGQTFRDWRRVLVFLTPFGRIPMDKTDGENWISVSYEVVFQVLEDLSPRTPGGAVALGLDHYLTMMRRHVMPNKEIEQLCRRLYLKHKGAINQILELGCSPRVELAEFAEAIFQGAGKDFELLAGGSSTFIRCSHKCLLQFKDSATTEWTGSQHLILIEFENQPDQFLLKLTMGPGEKGCREAIRRSLVSLNLFSRKSKERLTKYTELFTKQVLSTRDLETLSLDEMKTKIETAWSCFLAGDWQKIEAALLKDSGLTQWTAKYANTASSA